MSIRTRFAPSPTGYLHIGGARTALFSWLHARKHGGSFVLRIEDTDRERSTAESINAILEGMTWLGLEFDEGPLYQTNRFDRYNEVIQQLMDEGKAYPCYCSHDELEIMREKQRAAGEKPRYDGRCRHRTEPAPEGVDPVIRFKTPTEGVVVIDDQVKGRVTINNAELDDLIIRRSDGTPTYNLTVVVDDLDMNITHVIRGDDHLNNTPRQIHIMEGLGAKAPVFAHLPMILGADGSRLSKRHGAVSVMQFRDEGVMPEALLNYLARLGWSHGDQEIFSIDEMIQLFEVTKVNNSSASFDPDKLLWLNHQYIQHSDPARVAHHLSHHFMTHDIDPTTGPDPVELVMAMRERSKTLVELVERSLFFYRDVDDYDEKAYKKHVGKDIQQPLQEYRDFLQGLEEWNQAEIHVGLIDTAERHELKLGKLAQPIRVAVTGTAVSPPIDITLALLGREKTLARLDRLLARLATE